MDAMTCVNVDKDAGRNRRGEILHVAPNAAELLGQNGLNCPQDFYDASIGTRMVKNRLPGWRHRLELTLRDADGGDRRVFLKRFVSPPVVVQIRRILAGWGRFSHAGIEQHWIRRVGQSGVNVASVLAMTERRAGPWETRSALLLDAVRGESLERWVVKHPGRAPRRILNELAEFVRRFHQQGFIHRDLYLSHLFLTSESSESPTFCLIDLQRVLYRPWRHRRWVARDLAQLHYSVPAGVAGPRDRLRWLKRYLGGARLTTTEHRRLIARIEAKAARIGERDAIRQRRESMAGEIAA